MTITVLDIVSLFSSYDIYKYPLGLIPEFTREIYTTSLADPYLSPNIIIGDLEQSLTRRPSLFTWLKGLDLYTLNTDDSKEISLIAHSNLHSFTTNDGLFFSGPIFGDSSNGTLKIINFSNNEYVFKVSIEAFIKQGIQYTFPKITEIVFDITKYTEKARFI
ncbi:hypothetical protein ILT06_31165 [Bacillus sp. 17RED48]|nr:hypothetical protein [Bacillus sp. 17RED48]